MSDRDLVPHNALHPPLDSFETAQKQAEFLADSGLLPPTFRKRACDVYLLLEYANRLGLPAMVAMQHTSLIGNRVQLWGAAKLAVVMRHPEFEDINEVPSPDGMAWTCTIKRHKRTPVVRTFTMQMAQRMGLANRTPAWRTDPSRMIQHRARGRAIDDCFPDALMGLGADEMPPDDHSVEVDVGALEALPAARPAELTAEQLPAAEVAPPKARRGRPPGPQPRRGRRRQADAEATAAPPPPPLPTPPPVAPPPPPAPAAERQQTLPHGPRLVPSAEALRRTLQDMRDADTIDQLRAIALTASEGMDNSSPQYGSIVAQFHQCRSLLSAPEPQPSAPPSVTSLQDRQRQRDGA